MGAGVVTAGAGCGAGADVAGSFDVTNATTPAATASASPPSTSGNLERGVRGGAIAGAVWRSVGAASIIARVAAEIRELVPDTLDAAIATSASITACALCGRLTGSFASSRITSWSISGETCARLPMGSGSVNSCIAISSPAPSATNGGAPARSS